MKKWIVILLLMLTLCSCGQKKNDHSDDPAIIEGKYYVDLLENYFSREKNVSNHEDDPDFDKFLDKVFVEAMESDYMNLREMEI